MTGRTRWDILLACIMVVLLGIQVGGAETITVRHAAFESCTRDGGIAVSKAGGAVTLASSEHRVDYVGNHLAGRLRFGGERQGKKHFVLRTLGASGAELFVFGGKVAGSFNGVEIEFGKFPHNGGWMSAPIPAKLLRVGANEVVFRSGTRLAQDAEARPVQHSFLSDDGGKTWETAEGGEFLVALRLQRYPAQGIITSPVIDLASPADKDVVRPLLQVRAVRAEADAVTPPGTSVGLQTRTGKTPRPDNSWTAWQTGGAAPRRYVQWRALLQTDNRAATPTLRKVTVVAEATVAASADGLTVTRVANQRIRRSSYSYQYQPPSEKLTRLRDKFKLDEVVAAGTTDMEKLILLRNWVRQQWPHNDQGSGKRTWDALEILSAPAGQHGMCVHYGIAFSQCAMALGYNSRPLILTHHFVADVWLNDLAKWVLMDVESVQREGWNTHGTAHYVDVATRTPQSVLELHRALHRAMGKEAETVADIVQVFTTDDEQGAPVPADKIRSPKELGIFRRFAYPPRNNFLDQLEPWEEFHGQDHYHSDIYRWWYGDTPVARERHYTLQVTREDDLFWTINQAALTLTATAKPREVTVGVKTVTPNFAALLYRINDGAWEELEGDGDDPDERTASFLWRLAPGTNRLEVKPRNAFGKDGIVSSVEVRAAPAP